MEVFSFFTFIAPLFLFFTFQLCAAKRITVNTFLKVYIYIPMLYFTRLAQNKINKELNTPFRLQYLCYAECPHIMTHEQKLEILHILVNLLRPTTSDMIICQRAADYEKYLLESNFATRNNPKENYATTWTKTRLDKVVQMLKEKKPYTEIGAAFGVTSPAISYVVNHYKLRDKIDESI